MGPKSRRRLLVVAAVLVVAPIAARAQRATKPYRIGLLTVEYAEPIQQGLRELGYVEGQNVVYEVRTTQGRSDYLYEFTRELVRLNVDVIVAPNPNAVFSARRATSTIPIVMMHTPDPVRLGLVESLAKPGGNITGVTTLSADLSIKQLELLNEAIPGIRRVALVVNPSNPWHPIATEGLVAWSQSRGLRIQVLKLRGPDDFDSTFRAIRSERAQAVLVLADPVTFVHRQRLAALAMEHQLPMIGSLREYANAGSLMSYWADGTDVIRGAARYVDKILKGARPGDLPIEQPTRFEFVVNLKTAMALGLTIPPALLLRADHVIE